MNKIIFLDVDGTLVDYENQIPKSAIEAIRKARENGHKVYICTGRSRAEIYPELWDIGLDGMIGGNGSYIEDKGNIVMHKVLSLDECKKIVDWLHNKKLEFYLESNNGLFASENFETVGEKTIQEYSKRKGQADSETLTIRKAFPEMKFGEKLYRDDLNKISFILNSFDDYLEAKKVFNELEVNTWGGQGEIALFGDIGVKDINKGLAVTKLIEYLNANLENTIAFGDAKIDIPMFKCCKIGVAMGNGGPEIKEVATHITDSVEKDGLWKAFKNLNLI